MLRPQIDLSDDVADRVADYADDNGLKRSRAWGELVRAGLRAETNWKDPFVRAGDLETCNDCGMVAAGEYLHEIHGNTPEGVEYGLGPTESAMLCESCGQQLAEAMQ